MQEDFRFGILASLLANRHRGRGAKPWQSWDFFPSIPRPRPRRMSVTEMVENAKRWTLALGGKVQ